MEQLRQLLRVCGEAPSVGMQTKSQLMQRVFSLPSLGFVAGMLVWWLWMHRYRQRHHIGPKTWPIFGNFFEQAGNFDQLHDWLLQYFHRGCLTFHVHKFWIRNTMTADPNNVEYVLKTNFVNYPKVRKFKPGTKFTSVELSVPPTKERISLVINQDGGGTCWRAILSQGAETAQQAQLRFVLTLRNLSCLSSPHSEAGHDPCEQLNSLNESWFPRTIYWSWCNKLI